MPKHIDLMSLMWFGREPRVTIWRIWQVQVSIDLYCWVLETPSSLDVRYNQNLSILFDLHGKQQILWTDIVQYQTCVQIFNSVALYIQTQSWLQQCDVWTDGKTNTNGLKFWTVKCLQGAFGTISIYLVVRINNSDLPFMSRV